MIGGSCPHQKRLSLARGETLLGLAGQSGAGEVVLGEKEGRKEDKERGSRWEAMKPQGTERQEWRKGQGEVMAKARRREGAGRAEERGKKRGSGRAEIQDKAREGYGNSAGAAREGRLVLTPQKPLPKFLWLLLPRWPPAHPGCSLSRVTAANCGRSRQREASRPV